MENRGVKPAMTARGPLESASTFKSALKVYTNRAEVSRLSTGSHRLDQFLGGIESTRFYLFFGNPKEKAPDQLLYRLMVEAVQSGKVIYLICGNYRRDRTSLDSNLLLSLLEDAELDIDNALEQIHIIGVFSENQLMNAPSLVENLFEETGKVSLLAVQQVSKIFYSEKAIRFEDPAEFSGVLSKLRELCSLHNVPMVASCGSNKRTDLSPVPKGGTFFRHIANVIAYLRVLKGGEVSVYLVKHFDGARKGKLVRFSEEENVLGNITQASKRERIQANLLHLKNGFRETLDDKMQEAFNEVWEVWNHEQKALISSQIVSTHDLLNLTGVLSNHLEVENLMTRLEVLEENEY